MDLNISELTKLEVKYNQLQKAHAMMKNQLDNQSAKLKATNNNIAALREV